MPRRLARHLPLAVLLVACLALGLRTTSGLRWPHDADLYRNLAQAQVIADGHPFADPYYAGEKAWYNPLTPALIALLHALTGIPIPRLYTQAGAVLNLLVPLAFYVLVNTFFGRIAALVATLHVVFLGNPGEASWMRPAYSPWFFAGALGQVFFYLGLVAYARAAARGEARRYALVGGLLGLAFLSHTAPAVLLGSVIALDLFRRRGRGLGAAGLVFGVALLVSLPFLATILGAYGLRVVNPAGNDWYWWPFERARFLGYAASQLSLSALVAVAGFLALARRRARLAPALVLSWLALAVAFVLFALLSQWAAERGLHLLNVVAPHHFWLYLKAAAAVAFGFASSGVLRRGAERIGLAPAEPRLTAALTVSTLLISAAALPALAAGEEFARARKEALAESGKAGRDSLRALLRERASPDEVVLADPDDALMFVGPTGRKTVAVLANFANPYVAAAPREEAALAMLEALRRGDGPAFLARAAPYDVRWVLHRRSGRFGLDRGALPFLVREWREGPFVLYRVAPPAE